MYVLARDCRCQRRCWRRRYSRHWCCASGQQHSLRCGTNHRQPQLSAFHPFGSWNHHLGCLVGCCLTSTGLKQRRWKRWIWLQWRTLTYMGNESKSELYELHGHYQNMALGRIKFFENVTLVFLVTIQLVCFREHVSNHRFQKHKSLSPLNCLSHSYGLQ
jgi:hypothetical protein